MKKIKTISLLDCIDTHGHGPLKFLCEDFNIYYAKFSTTIDSRVYEIDSLFSEVVCNMLLKFLEVPTPDLAILDVVEGSYCGRHLKRHHEIFKPGGLYLGSKQIRNSDLMNSLIPIDLEGKRSNERIYDLLKVAIFDLWVNNCDRGRSGNYNILIKYTSTGQIYYAFDHGFCFGGLTHFSNGKLQLFTACTRNRFYKSVCFIRLIPFFDKIKARYIIDNFFEVQQVKISHILGDAYRECPNSWNVSGLLKEQIFNFLTNRKRIDNIKDVIWASLN